MCPWAPALQLFCGLLSEGQDFMGCCFLFPPVWQKYPVILTTVWPQLQRHLPPLPVVSLDQEQPPLFLPAGTVGGVHFLGNVKSKRKWGVSWLGSFSPCWNESAVPPLHTLQPVIFFYACQVCFLMYAIVTPKEGIEIWYEQSFSKHLLCGRQPRNRKWVLCPQGTCHIRGEIKPVNKLGC